MDKNLRNIFRARYGAVLLLLISGILILYISSGFTFVKSWQSQNTWYHSKEFTKDYVEDTYNIKYHIDDEAIYYEDIEEYRQEKLTLFQSGWPTSVDTLTNARFKPDHSYQKGVYYWSQFNYSAIVFSPWILFILGFSLFFIDLKTNFNAFLFSLPFTKKQLFKGKLLYTIPVILISLAIGILVHQVLVYTMIPKLYVNATLGQMIYSGVSHWFLLLLALSSGVFIGTLLGNLVTGPLLVVAGFISLAFFNEFLSEISNLLNYFGLDNNSLFFHKIFGDSSTMTIVNLGKSGSTIATLVLFFVISVLALFAAEKIFENTSLESNGKVLTVPRFRRRFFITLAVVSSLYFTISGVGLAFHLEYYGYLPLFLLILVLSVCTISSFIITYYDEIFKFWNKRYLDRMTRKIQ